MFGSRILLGQDRLMCLDCCGQSQIFSTESATISRCSISGFAKTTIAMDPGLP